jgi:hypothetical protein
MARVSTKEELEVVQFGGRERRRHHRFPCSGPAEFWSLECRSFYKGEVKDVSLAGCYISTGDAALELAAHDNVQLCLRINGELLETPARMILARTNSGVAFEFLPVDPGMRAALLTILQNLGSAESQPLSALEVA